MTMVDDGTQDTPWQLVPSRLVESWVQAFHHAWDRPSIRVDIPCPHCGATAL